MARTYPLYLSVATNKYGINPYGDIWKYGLQYPPPKPQDLQVIGGPTIVSGVPTFSWVDPVFAWSLIYGQEDVLSFDLQISFNDPSFSTIDKNPNLFIAPSFTYKLAPEYLLQKEGTYYARIRSTDGYTYSDWSDSLQFVLFLFGAYPPILNPVTSPAGGFWQVITGKKGSGLYIFVRNNKGDWSQATYPNGLSGSTWQFNVPLTRGNNFVEVISALTTHTEAAISRPVSANIYLLVSTPETYNVWNCFDEFGLLLGLPRIPGEKNKDYRIRLLDVYTNPANSTYSGLRNGISRELGLRISDITINRLSDLMDPTYSDNLLNSEGNALGTKLVDYADEVYDSNPLFWGNIVCDENYWDGVDETVNGYVFLPHIWDPSASGLYDKWQAGGIGDNDDLWVNNPIEIWNPGISGYSWYLPIHAGHFYSAYPSGILGV